MCILFHLDVPDTSPTSTVSLSHDNNEGISIPQYSESSHQTQQRKDTLGNKFFFLYICTDTWCHEYLFCFNCIFF